MHKKQTSPELIEILRKAHRYISNQTMKGVPHPQQKLLDDIEKQILNLSVNSYGSLDDGVPNYFDPSKRGFQP